MKIENNIIKYYLKNVYFITGTAYAGKSTMVSMLARKYDLIECGENYHSTISNNVANEKNQPFLSYFQTMKDWQEYVNRTPEEFEQWIYGVSREAAEFEIAELIRISADRKVIVDTNIPIDLLHEITEYDHVAIMLSPQAMSVERFFDREDPDKRFILEQIEKSNNPQQTMDNFRKCIAKVNSQEYFNEYANSGFFTTLRLNADTDTREEILNRLAYHFKFNIIPNIKH